MLSVGDFAVGQDNGIPKHFKVLRLQYKGDYRFGVPLHEYINQDCKYIIRAMNKSACSHFVHYTHHLLSHTSDIYLS